MTHYVSHQNNAMPCIVYQETSAEQFTSLVKLGDQSVKSGIQCFGSLPVKLPPESIVGLQSRKANICSIMMTNMEFLSMVGRIEEPEWQRIFGLDTIREAISQISGTHIGIAHRTIMYFFDTYLKARDQTSWKF
jgi:hypothetical protein